MKNIYTCLGVIFLLCLHIFPMWAQLNHLRFAEYATRDGLSSNQVTNVIQDKAGFLWIGSAEGLNRFDGHEFKVFRPRHGDSTSIHSPESFPLFYTDDDQLWVSTILGLTIYDSRTGKFKRLVHNPNDSTSAPPFARTMMQDSKKRLWLSGSTGWFLYHPETQKFTHYYYTLPEKDYTTGVRGATIEAMVEITDNTFWVVSNFGLYHFELSTGKIERYLFDYSKTTLSEANLFTSVYFDRKNELLWMGTWAGGLVRFDGRTRQFKQYLFTESTKVSNHNIIIDILPKSENEIWIASADFGFGMFSISEEKFSFYRPPENSSGGLPVNAVQYLAKDRQQNLWISTNRGLYRLNAKSDLFRWMPITKVRATDAYHYVQTILKDTTNQQIYLGLDIGDGIIMYSEKNKIFDNIICDSCKTDSSFPFNVQHLLKDTKGRIWVASNQGLYRLLPEQRKMVREAAFGNKLKGDEYAIKIIELSDGSLLIISRWNGFYHYHPESGSIVHYDMTEQSPVKLLGNRISDIIEHRPGKLLIVGDIIGLYQLDLEKKKTSKVASSGILNSMNSYRQIIRDDADGFWVATFRTGIAHLTPKADTFAIERYFEDGSQPGSRVSHMILDDQNQLWMATQSGLLIMNTKTKKTRVFNEYDGLVDNELWQSFYKAPDGEMIIGRDGGIIRFNPANILKNSLPPQIAITSFKVMEKELVDSIPINHQTRLEFPHNQNLMAVSFAGLDFIEPRYNQYAYQLEGLDKDWIVTGNRNYFSYANIPPGDYTLKIKATSSDGVDAPQPISIFISIQPPFWETTLFYIIVIFSTLATMGTIHWYRISQVRAREQLKRSLQEELAKVEMKALRAQMNPHFIFNSLNSINGYIAKNEQKEASHYLARFARLIRQILDNAQHDFIPLQSEINTLSLYIEMEAVRFENRFNYSITVDEALAESPLLVPSMVIQPYIENAIWHGLMHQTKKGKLTVLFKKLNDNLIKVIIEDDGVGRERATILKSKSGLREKSYGMSITSDRIKLLNEMLDANATQQLEDLFDEDGQPAGTRVTLQLPLKADE